MKIVPYNECYFEQLVAFMRTNWADNHSLYDENLFNWQYSGCGFNEDSSASRILLDENDEIQGFKGAIPYPFIFNGTVSSAAALAMWVVNKNYINPIAGIKLINAVENCFPILCCIGLAQTTIRYWQMSNYCYHDSLNRYVIPLDAEGYQLFLVESNIIEEIKVWSNAISYTSPAMPTESINSHVLAELYKESTVPYFKLVPQKNAKFWAWRYLSSKGFSYLFYQDAGGILIFRVECVYASDDSLRHGIKCLRIIEIIPQDGNVWHGYMDSNLIETITSVLTWAKGQGCVLADFQISNSRLSQILHEVGFWNQLDNGPTNIARVFSPLRFDASPLNFAYRVLDDGNYIKIDREDTYLLKSDADMDRPNYLV